MNFECVIIGSVA